MPTRLIRYTWNEIGWGWLSATLLSGIPSTLYALITGGDIWQATKAAGAMLISADTSLAELVLAAAVVHIGVSLFWALILAMMLPRRHVILWAVAAAIAIAVVDLRIIAPHFFPEVAQLSFWPQLADHIAWGAAFGGGVRLHWSRSRALR